MNKLDTIIESLGAIAICAGTAELISEGNEEKMFGLLKEMIYIEIVALRKIRDIEYGIECAKDKMKEGVHNDRI